MTTRDTEILVVDDEEALRNVVRRMLSRAGLKVETAGSAEEAIALLRQGRRFDTIVSDLLMPGMDGMGLFRVVRQMDLDVPVIILTGNPSIETAMLAMEHGGFRYLAKPVEHQHLVAVVKDAAAHHRLSLLKRKALEVCEAGGWLLENLEDLDERFARALEHLWIAYQPIVLWPENRVFGYEALVRSADADLATPGKLIDAAERLGRVQELGQRVRSAIAASAAYAPAESLLFANLHALDLTSDDLYASSSGLAAIAERVVLEITERASLYRIEDLQGRIQALRQMGFRIAVDDLGASYGGLSTFRQLGPDLVKLDMSLVRDIDDSSVKESLVRSMISVCTQELGIRVVCEGVETVKERDTLQRVGADLLQGFLFARPQRGFEAMSA